MRLSNAVKRALRTFMQAFTGVVMTSGILSAVGTGEVVDVGNVQKVLVSAIAAGVVSLVSYFQNSLEDSGTIPAVLKSESPVPPIE